MKPSCYNLYIPLKNNHYILFNTFTTAIFFVDEELKTAIQNDPSSIPEKAVPDFKKEWVLIDDDFNERDVITVKRNESVFNSPYLSFTILTTTNCNLDCPYCFEKKGTTTMDTSTCERVIECIKKFIAKYRPIELNIRIFGGEPLLYMDPMVTVLDYFTGYCTEHSVDFTADITTNGTLLTQDVMTQLEKYPMGVAQVTLDGPKDMHNKKRIYKNGKGTYEDIISALHILKDSFMELKVRINVDSTNKDAIPILLDDLKERGLGGILVYFGIVRPLSPECEAYDKSCMTDLETSHVIPVLWKAALQRGFQVPLKVTPNLVGCGMQSASAYTIGLDGYIYKCVTKVGHPEQSVGHVHAEDMPHWSPEYYTWLSRNPLEFSECKSCIYFPLCGGGCPMIAYSKKGTYQAGGCFETKNILREQIKM
ncbi:MAG: SPASM domain-containing protein [Candidatus Methanofastidiosia archaeon]|jgi:uncharacterized protein